MLQLVGFEVRVGPIIFSACDDRKVSRVKTEISEKEETLFGQLVSIRCKQTVTGQNLSQMKNVSLSMTKLFLD